LTSPLEEPDDIFFQEKKLYIQYFKSEIRKYIELPRQAQKINSPKA
jgi:hypothetical protein